MKVAKLGKKKRKAWWMEEEVREAVREQTDTIQENNRKKCARTIEE